MRRTSVAAGKSIWLKPTPRASRSSASSPARARAGSIHCRFFKTPTWLTKKRIPPAPAILTCESTTTKGKS